LLHSFAGVYGFLARIHITDLYIYYTLLARTNLLHSVNVELSPVTDKLAPGDRAARGKLQKAKLDKLCAAASAQFRQRCGESLLPALAAFKPDLLLISAGFDGHWEDNVSTMH
jgi:acetoin utilization deacetylase AcuC-like enzyme